MKEGLARDPRSPLTPCVAILHGVVVLDAMIEWREGRG
jgi:hypothetical protein